MEDVAIRYSRLFFAGMTGHQVGPSCFMVAAGSCILGAQAVPLARDLAAAAAFLGLGAAPWMGSSPPSRLPPRLTTTHEADGLPQWVHGNAPRDAVSF